jgi:hypothetical protein
VAFFTTYFFFNFFSDFTSGTTVAGETTVAGCIGIAAAQTRQRFVRACETIVLAPTYLATAAYWD